MRFPVIFEAIQQNFEINSGRVTLSFEKIVGKRFLKYSLIFPDCYFEELDSKVSYGRLVRVGLMVRPISVTKDMTMFSGLIVDEEVHHEYLNSDELIFSVQRLAPEVIFEEFQALAHTLRPLEIEHASCDRVRVISG